MDRYEAKLNELGFTLPAAPAKAGLCEQSKPDGNGLVWVSGCLPTENGKVITGKAGDVTLEEAQRAATASILNLLSVLKRDLGSLECIDMYPCYKEVTSVHSLSRIARMKYIPDEQWDEFYDETKTQMSAEFTRPLIIIV